MSDATVPGVADAASRAREQVLAALANFRGTVESRFDPPGGSPLNDAARHDLLLGVELWLKLEEHVVAPALRDAEVASTSVVKTLGHEGEVLRDLMSEHGQSPGVVENAARRHMQATDALLSSGQARTWLNWTRVHGDMQAWMKRWRDEIAERGDIEDEESDPVGLPPR